MNIENIVVEGTEKMNKSIDHLKSELSKIRAGRANVGMLDGIMVDYYNTPTKLSQVANLSTPDSKTISMQPWEKGMLAVIEQAIFAANLGLTPMNDGEFIRISIPPLTEERRKELVKQCKGLAEEAKVGLRNERSKLMQVIKQEVKDGYPEDMGKKRETEVQNLTNSFGVVVDKLIVAKEADIMKV